jgi:hypothetical protein
MGPPQGGYYVAAPPGPPMYPAPPVYQAEPASSPIPWWVWMGAGVLAANVARVVSRASRESWPRCVCAQVHRVGVGQGTHTGARLAARQLKCVPAGNGCSV